MPEVGVFPADGLDAEVRLAHVVKEAGDALHVLVHADDDLLPPRHERGERGEDAEAIVGFEAGLDVDGGVWIAAQQFLAQELEGHGAGLAVAVGLVAGEQLAPEAAVVVVGEAQGAVAGAELVEDGVKLPEEGGLGVREGAQREAGIFLEADDLLGPGCGAVGQDVGVDEEVRGVMRWLFHGGPPCAAVRAAVRPTARIR